MTQPTAGRLRFMDGPFDPLPPSVSGQPDANGETIIASLPPGAYAIRETATGVNLVRNTVPDKEQKLRAINAANRARYGLPLAGRR